MEDNDRLQREFRTQASMVADAIAGDMGWLDDGGYPEEDTFVDVVLDQMHMFPWKIELKTAWNALTHEERHAIIVTAY